LNGRFATRELRFVLAHELGHLARNHLWKGLAWYALFALPGAAAIAVATRGRGGMKEPAAVPLALFVLTALALAAQPLQAALSRHMESEADWMALRTTRDPAAGRALFHEFGVAALDEPNPPLWDYLVLEDHPTLMQRIVEGRRAMMNAVRSPSRSRSAPSIFRSVPISTDDVASSRIRIRGSASRARANATSWRWPSDSREPRSCTSVS